MKNIFVFLTALCVFNLSQAQTYDVDRSYGTHCGVTALATIGGVSVNSNTLARGSYIYPDGSVVSVYQFYSGIYSVGLVKLDANGDLVTSFGSGGTIYYSGYGQINCIDTGSNGKIFIAGGYGTPYIACFNSNGSLNYHVTGTPSFSGSYFGVVVQPDGKAITFGFNNSSIVVRRYNTNGTIDGTYGGLWAVPGTNPANIFTDQQGRGILQSNGKAVFCWHAGPTAGDPRLELYLTRLNLDGTLDNTFGTGSFTNTGFSQPCATVSATSLTAGVANMGFRKISGDKMRVGSSVGNCSGAPANLSGKVMQFTANGLPDNSFGTSGAVNLYYSNFQTAIYDIVVDAATDKTYAFGGGGQSGLIFRLNSNGTLDNTFNGTGLKPVAGFGNYYAGIYSYGFDAGGLYSADRMLVNMGYADAAAHGGVTHSVIDLTNAQLSIAATPDCGNNQIILNVADQNLSCYTYQWYKDGAPISGATGTSYTATTNGNYYVSGSYLPPPTGAAGLPPGATNSNTINVNMATMCGAPIPTLSQWGLIIFGLLLLCTGAVTVWNARYGSTLAKSRLV